MQENDFAATRRRYYAHPSTVFERTLEKTRSGQNDIKVPMRINHTTNACANEWNGVVEAVAVGVAVAFFYDL